MERPMMHPSFLDEADSSAGETKAPRKRIRIVRPVLRFVGRVLFGDAFSLGRRRDVTIEGVPFLTRVFRGLLYRLAFVPIFVVAVVAAIVFAGTHPPTSAVHADP